MEINDYDALAKITSLIIKDNMFEEKLLKYRLSTIDKYHSELGFYSWDLSEKMKDLFRYFDEMKLHQIKFLFKELPPVYNNPSQVG
jgi:hypothetical protein